MPGYMKTGFKFLLLSIISAIPVALLVAILTAIGVAYTSLTVLIIEIILYFVMTLLINGFLAQKMWRWK